jgi:hypothetical protein
MRARVELENASAVERLCGSTDDGLGFEYQDALTVRAQIGGGAESADSAADDDRVPLRCCHGHVVSVVDGTAS